MADTFSTRLRALLIEPFTKFGTWGSEANEGTFQRIDDAWAIISVVVNGPVTLTAVNALEDQARSFGLVLTGAGNDVVTTPAVDKPYLIVNNCAADVTITPFSGTGAVVRAGTAVMWYCDGTNGYVVDLPLNKIKAPTGAVDFNGQRATNAADPVSAQDLATRAFVLAYGGPGAYESALAAAASAAAALVSENNAAAYAASINPSLLQPRDATLTTLSALPLAQGDLLYATAADTLVRLPKGTALQKLRMNAAATAPEWSSPPGELVQIGATVTVGAAVAQVDFAGIDSTYDCYELRFDNVAPSTDQVEMWLLTSTDAGASFDAGAADYAWGGVFCRPSSPGVVVHVGDPSDAKLAIAIGDGSTAMLGNATGEKANGWIRLTRPSDAAMAAVSSHAYWLSANAGNPVHFSGFGTRLAAADVNGLRLKMSSGNIASGTFKLFGIRN